MLSLAQERGALLVECSDGHTYHEMGENDAIEAFLASLGLRGNAIFLNRDDDALEDFIRRRKQGRCEVSTTDNTHVIDAIIADLRKSLPTGGVICVTGLGASGKSEMVEAIVRQMSPGEAGHYVFDKLYYADAQRRRIRVDGDPMSGCCPRSFDRSLALACVEGISRGAPVATYDKEYSEQDNETTFHEKGTYTPKTFNFIDGLAAMHRGLWQYYDYIIFMDCHIDVERTRRLHRDICVKGKDPNDVIRIFDIRRKQYEKYVEPFKDCAHMHVRSNADYTIDYTLNQPTAPCPST